VNGTRIDITWSSDPASNSDNATYLLLLYFAEVQRLPRNALRQFDILVDNATWNGSRGFTPRYLSAEAVRRMVQGAPRHTFSLVATPEATHPPILNAFEIYTVKPMAEPMTNDMDGICLTLSLRQNVFSYLQEPTSSSSFALCCLHRDRQILTARVNSE
jgi:hypothetical protein